MKKLIISAVIMLSAITTNAYADTYSPDCITGTIQSFQYNSNDSVSLKIKPTDGSRTLEMYTSKWDLRPFLFSAYILKTKVSIYTNDCYEYGGFAKVLFSD